MKSINFLNEPEYVLQYQTSEGCKRFNMMTETNEQIINKLVDWGHLNSYMSIWINGERCGICAEIGSKKDINTVLDMVRKRMAHGDASL